MQCPICKLEMFVDHVTTKILDDEEVVTYYYVCKNPVCTGAGKVESATGESVPAQIIDKGAVACCGQAIAYISSDEYSANSDNLYSVEDNILKVTCSECGKIHSFDVSGKVQGS